MEFEALRTFVTVVDQQSFTKAANLLSLSQPTVSSHIKNLERYFETRLIERSPKHFKVTQTGEMVYERGRQLLAIIEKAKSEVKEFENQWGGTVHIGASYTVGEYILPRLIKAFDEQYPTIDVKVTIANTEEINRGVQLHEIDVALVEGQVPNKGLHSEPFMKDEMVILVPAHHPLWSKKKISFHDLQDQVWVTRESGSGTRAMLDSMLKSYNIRPRKTITIGSNHGVVQCVKQGLGFSFISKTVVDHSEAEDLMMDLSYIPTASRYFSLIMPSNEEEISTHANLFIQKVRDVYNMNLS
ncbi:LysR family transcriptional regulator [Halobacillus fulvus]|nr:LysR family transcriptional regulator [Halobacillus fulvus]